MSIYLPTGSRSTHFPVRRKSAQRIWKEVYSDMSKFKSDNPGLIEGLQEIMSWNNFAADLISQFNDRGSLSEKQTFAAAAMLAKIKVKKSERDNAPEIDLSNVAKVFSKAHEAVKTPKFRYDDIVISRAPDHGVNKGALYVKSSGAYAGKVKDGKFFTVNSAPSDVLSKLKLIAEDPLGSAIAYGRKTGQCACCGRELTNHGSIELGIGPICREKWGL
tara:strand:- start:22 stop:675 length:654 start_codon:yes stop_codon:yes gene_type:complete